MIKIFSQKNVGFLIEKLGWTRVFFSDASNNKTFIGETFFDDFTHSLKLLIEPLPINREITEYKGYNISKICVLDNGPTLICADDLGDKLFLHIRSFMEDAKAHTIGDFIITRFEIKKWLETLEKELKNYK